MVGAEAEPAKRRPSARQAPARELARASVSVCAAARPPAGATAASASDSVSCDSSQSAVGRTVSHRMRLRATTRSKIKSGRTEWSA